MANLKFKILMVTLLVFLFTTTLISQTIIRVNCGGDEYWDVERNQWYADQPYTPGSWGYENPGYFLFYEYPISGTNDDPLYQHEHNALDNYKFTVPNGTYIVTLKFAELYYDNVGDRIFHVEIEGDRVLDNFDILAEVGFAAACDKTFQLDVSDGVLDILFITIEVEPGVTLAHANIKAISIVEQGTHEPKLWVNPHEIDFFDYSNHQYFEVKNGGELPLEWNCFEDPDETWITDVSPTSGTLYQGQSQRIDVYVSRSGLEDGQYEGNITINSNGGNDNVKVLMQVESDKPIIQVEPTSLNYGAILTKRIFKIRNVGTANLSWTADNKNSDNWIKKIDPTSGQIEPGTYQEISVTVDRTGLTDNAYQGIIEVESNGGDRDVDLFIETSNNPLNINCGGYQYIDKNNHIWFNDFGFEGGQTAQSNQQINNTEDDPLYQHARISPIVYQFAVQKNGFYEISLHFAEFQHSAIGERIFDVQIEDSLVLTNFDIYAESGSYSALIKNFQINVTDHLLSINFVPRTGNPCIAAIQISQIPFLEIETTDLNFLSILTKRDFTIKNCGTAQLNWSAQNMTNDPWLIAISPSTGTLAPHDSQLVDITIDRTGLTDSLYTGNIQIETNGGDQTLSVVFETKNKPLRINCGGLEYYDNQDNQWLADMQFSGGHRYSFQDSVANTFDDQLYQTIHAGMTKYEFPVQQNGLYEISLHFVEFQHNTTGQRRFDVQIEDSLVLDNFDIFNESGKFFAVLHTVDIEVDDNQLDISFIPDVGEPCISAIEIFLRPMLAIQPFSLKYGSLLTKQIFSLYNTGPVELNWSIANQNIYPWLVEISPKNGILAPTDTQSVIVAIDRAGMVDSSYQGNIVVESDAGNQNVLLTFETKNDPLRINCGGTEYLDTHANLWFNDLLFIGGNSYSCLDSIANTPDDLLYQTARNGVSRYELPLQNNGLFEIVLHFAELQYNAADKRIFDVKIENSLILNDFDIYHECGSFSAIVKSTPIQVNDNQLDIVFLSKVGEPCISAIEIIQKPIMTVEPADLNFGSMLTRQIFSVINQGIIDLNWSAEDQNNEPWLKDIIPNGGILAPLDTQLVTIIIDRNELPDSMTFRGHIIVEADGTYQDISLLCETTNEPLRINCGGTEYLDNSASLWLNDILSVGGYAHSCQDSIANTLDDRLYQTARMAINKYQLAIQDNGWYSVVLHFAELQYNSAGQRVFDVQIEDSLAIQNFDIYTESGRFTAVTKIIDVKVEDNQLDIVFSAKTGEPCISAIEVHQVAELPTDIGFSDNCQSIPERFELEQNHPNPFNMETQIAYQLPVAGRVTLEVYNLLGQKQKTLVFEQKKAGFHTTKWDGKDLNGNAVTSGLYIYKIQVVPENEQSKSFQQVRKMLLLK